MSANAAIAVGFLKRAPDEAPQTFAIFLLAEDAIELRFDASRIKRTMQVQRLAGYEVKMAIENRMGGQVTIDYARSRLTWGGVRGS